MTSDAPTKARKHITSNVACASSQRYTKDSVVWFVQTLLCFITKCPAFCQGKRHLRWSTTLVVYTSDYHTLGNVLGCKMSVCLHLKCFINVNYIEPMYSLMLGRYKTFSYLFNRSPFHQFWSPFHLLIIQSCFTLNYLMLKICAICYCVLPF